MGRLNEVSDELWTVALAALESSMDEATDDVRADLEEGDYHGRFVLSTLSRAWRARFREMARPRP